MDIATVRQFFMWCTILNGSLLVLTSLICAFAGDWVYKVQSRWFTIPREVFNVAIYAYLGVLKVLVLVFNLVPYLALLIVD